jgi:hypothetical protein
MRTAHKYGLDVLGSSEDTFLGAEAPTGAFSSLVPGKKKRALVIQIANAPQLAAAAGGTAGEWAASLAPDTIEQQVYARVADEMSAALRAKGVDASIKVVDAGSWALAEDDLGAAKYTTLGFAGAGVLGLLGYFWLRTKK